VQKETKEIIQGEFKKRDKQLETKLDKKFEQQAKINQLQIQELFAEYEERNRQRHADLLGAIAEALGRTETFSQELTVGTHQIHRNTRRIEKIEAKVFGQTQL
jgi:hypothetical protein